MLCWTLFWVLFSLSTFFSAFLSTTNTTQGTSEPYSPFQCTKVIITISICFQCPPIKFVCLKLTVLLSHTATAWLKPSALNTCTLWTCYYCHLQIEISDKRTLMPANCQNHAIFYCVSGNREWLEGLNKCPSDVPSITLSLFMSKTKNKRRDATFLTFYFPFNSQHIWEW